MAPQRFMSTKAPTRETVLLQRLLGLYVEERQIYSQVLALSHRQGDLVKQGAPLTEVRRVLEKKKNCLEIIGRLELTEQASKTEWEQGRHSWSVQSRTRLHEALQDVTRLIEEILICEEKNDVYLMEKAQVV